MTHSNSKNEDPTLLKNIIVDKIKELRYRSEKQEFDNLSESPKIGNDFCKKCKKCPNKKAKQRIFTEILIGSGSTIANSTMSIANLNAGALASSFSAPITSIALLITIEFISKVKIR